MEGQNKRTEVQIECSECGDVFPVSPELADLIDPEQVVCTDCEEA
jgi:hypothetical protein